MLASIADWQRYQADAPWLRDLPWAALTDLRPSTDQLAEAVRLTTAAVNRSNRLRRDPRVFMRSTLLRIVRGH